jgi:hypothetical protein
LGGIALGGFSKSGAFVNKFADISSINTVYHATNVQNIESISNGIDFTFSESFIGGNRFGKGFYSSLDKATPWLENSSANTLLSFKVDISSLNVLNATSSFGSFLTRNKIGAFAIKQFSLAGGYDAILASSVRKSGSFNLIFINQQSTNKALRLSENFSLKSSSKVGSLNLP